MIFIMVIRENNRTGYDKCQGNKEGEIDQVFEESLACSFCKVPTFRVVGTHSISVHP